MSCVEVEQLMANPSELSNLLISTEADLHANSFSTKEANYDLNDVSICLS